MAKVARRLGYFAKCESCGCGVLGVLELVLPENSKQASSMHVLHPRRRKDTARVSCLATWSRRESSSASSLKASRVSRPI